MAPSISLKLPLDSFQQASHKVSTQIKNAKSLWDDDSYQSLESAVKQISKEARQVSESGNIAIKSVDNFFSIAQEPI